MSDVKHKVPLVSVVIPTYNRSPIIVETLRNVFLQTYSNFEVILVDDASTDDTEDVVKTSFTSHINSGKLRYFRNKENMERSFSRNRGAQVGKGEFIAFLDSDDIWQPEHIESGINYIIKSSADMFYSLPAFTDSEHAVNVEKVIEERESRYTNDLTGIKMDELVVRGVVIYPSGMLIRRKLLTQSGGFRVDIFVAEDWEMVNRLFFKFCAKICCSFKPTYFIRIHSDNTFASEKYWAHSFEIIKNDDLLSYIRFCSFIGSHRKNFLTTNLLITRGKIAISRGMLIVGWGNLFQSIKLDYKVLFFNRRGVLYFALKRGFMPRTVIKNLKRMKPVYATAISFFSLLRRKA